MPCYLFTYHAYGTWLPDRPRGYVHWREGLLPADKRLATAYRRNMRQESAAFAEKQQLALIEELQSAAAYQSFRLHAVATETTHLHVLASWTDDRLHQAIGAGIRQSTSRRLTAGKKQKWLAKGGSQKRVKDLAHFTHMMETYLPSHRGWKWDERRHLYR